MSLSTEAYARQLKQLLPRGLLWKLEPDSWLSKLLLAIADELARSDARGEDLVDEWDPRSALETLTDWERVLGITPALGATTIQRQTAITAAVVARGGSTPAYFISLAASLGFVATIDGPGTVPTPIPFVAAGTLSDNGQPGVPAGYAANDVFLTVVAGNPAAPSGWTQLATYTSYFGVYWRRSTASETAPNFGAGYRCRMAAYRGAITTETPIEVIGTVGTASGSLTSHVPGANAPSITTLSARAMVLLARGEYVDDAPELLANIAYLDPASGQPAQALAFSNGAGPVATARGIGLWHDIRLTAGATGIASGSHADLSASGGTYASGAVLLAMKPAPMTLAAHNWRMNVDLSGSTGLVMLDFRSGTGRSGDRLGGATVADLETVINRAKPAHTAVAYAYV